MYYIKFASGYVAHRKTKKAAETYAKEHRRRGYKVTVSRSKPK